MLKKIYSGIGIAILAASVLFNLYILYISLSAGSRVAYQNGVNAGIDQSVLKIFEYYDKDVCKELPVSIGEKEIVLLNKSCEKPLSK